MGFVVHNGDPKHRDQIFLGQLGKDWTADQVEVTLSAPEEVVFGVDDGDLVASPLGAYRLSRADTSTTSGTLSNGIR